MKTQTYTEYVGQKPIDWNRELKAAKEKEPDTKKYEELASAATSWVTCACGNQCADIPRFDTGAPKDAILFNLGKRFYNHVKARQWNHAHSTLAEIEARVTILL